MSEKVKTMAEKIATLPNELQDKFMDKVDGAIMAMELMEETNTAKESQGKPG